MSNDSSPTKTYVTLREAFNLVGKKIFGTKWQGLEADCNPAKVDQPTETRSLLHKLSSDEKSYSKECLPVPTRPLEGQDQTRLREATKRHARTLTELLRLLNSGLVSSEFIPDDNAITREVINASSWPDPKTFNPIMPVFHNLGFDLSADRVVIKSSGKSAASVHGRDYGDLWWAYTGRPGHVEIDKEVLKKALRSAKGRRAGLSREDQKKGGSRPKYNHGLQTFINQLCTEFVESGKLFSLATVKDWLFRNARAEEPYESGIRDCDDLEFVEGALFWIDRHGRSHSRRARSLEPYIQRAKRR